MGFGPTTSAVTGRRSNQLSHRAKKDTCYYTTLVFKKQVRTFKTEYSSCKIKG